MTQIAATYEPSSSVKPWDDPDGTRNPRVNDHAVDEVAKSILRFGFGAPLVARTEDRMVIAGHTRLKAHLLLEGDVEATKEALNLDEEVDAALIAKLPLPPVVPVRFLDLSIEEARMLALADNKTGEVAFWDEGALADIFASLGDDPPLFGTGFDDTEVNFLLGEWNDPFDSGDEGAPDEIQDDGTARITIKVANTDAATVHEVLRDGLESAGVKYTVVSS